MKKKVVLIYETDINYDALDLAIAACKKRETDLKVLFIYSVKDEKQGYGFPSDISLVETVTNERDILLEDTEILLLQTKLTRERAAAENIPVTIVAYKKLSAATLQKIMDEAEEVYVDASMHIQLIREAKLFSLGDIQVNAICPVVLVKKN
jgi:hypothetical protein